MNEIGLDCGDDILARISESPKTEGCSADQSSINPDSGYVTFHHPNPFVNGKSTLMLHCILNLRP